MIERINKVIWGIAAGGIQPDDGFNQILTLLLEEIKNIKLRTLLEPENWSPEDAFEEGIARTKEAFLDLLENSEKMEK